MKTTHTFLGFWAFNSSSIRQFCIQDSWTYPLGMWSSFLQHQQRKTEACRNLGGIKHAAHSPSMQSDSWCSESAAHTWAEKWQLCILLARQTLSLWQGLGKRLYITSQTPKVCSSTLSRGWFRQFKSLETCRRGPFHPLATPLVLSYLDPCWSSPSSAIQQELWALTPTHRSHTCQPHCPDSPAQGVF